MDAYPPSPANGKSIRHGLKKSASHQRSKSIPYFKRSHTVGKESDKEVTEDDILIEMDTLSTTANEEVQNEEESTLIQEDIVEIQHGKSSEPPRSLGRNIYNIFTSSWLNLFLILLPFTALFFYFKWNNLALFIMSTMSLVPLSNLLVCTSLRPTNMNLTFLKRYAMLHIVRMTPKPLGNAIGIIGRNAIPLIIGVFAVTANNSRIVQATIVGNILIRLSLIYGFTYLPSIRKQYIVFDRRSNGVAISIMITSCFFLLVPAIFTTFGPSYMNQASVLLISRWSSIVMLLGLVFYIIFSVKTNTAFWNLANRQRIGVNIIGAIVLFILVLTLISLESFFIMSTIYDIAYKGGLSITFIASVLLPAAYNAVDTVKTLEVAFQQKHDTNVFIVTKSVAELCLFISPLLIILSWILSNSIGLDFFPFEGVAVISFMAVFHVITSNGKSNWLQGSLLIILYVIVSMCLFFLPDSQ